MQKFPIGGSIGSILVLILCFSSLAIAQSSESVTIRVAVIDKNLSTKNVPKFSLVVLKVDDPAFAEQKLATSFDGIAALSLAPGEYLVRSEKSLEFEGKTYAWEQRFKVESGKPLTVELSNDNAKIIAAFSDSATSPRRRVSEEGELFKTLRDGVVTVEGELGSGTGFIIDDKGLVLTNQHVISKSNEIRVRFDKQTAVRARLLAEDADRDIAVLQINLEAFPKSRILKLAEPKPDAPSVIEGERVFTIGSPLFQDKILTAGIASKVEERAIISDININPGNSGGPLFNSLGEVVGLTTFGIQSGGGPGISGIVRIEESAALVKTAREKAEAKGLPSPALMPNLPEGTFSVDTIKAQIDVKKFPKKEYMSDIKNYQIDYVTPVFKFYASEKDRLESLKNRNKRNEKKGAIDTADRFRDLRNWSEYAGQLRPTVDILALPEVTVTGKSLFLGLAGAAAGVPPALVPR